MQEDETGIKVNETLKHWHFLLEEWILLLKRYCRFMEGGEPDAPYFYSERANIGLLSAAAWRAGWIALEEFGIRKHTTKQGRADLWFWPADQDKEEYIEAKQRWKIPRNINKLLDHAVNDAKEIKLIRKSDSSRIGLIFICPEVPERFESQLDSKIQELINYSKKIKCDALGWFFPFNYNKLKLNGFYYPGIILLAKVVK